MAHDLVSASQPSACVECEREWKEIVAQCPQEAMRSRANISIEGLTATEPIFQIAVHMSLDEEKDVPTTDGPGCGDELCDIYLDVSREQNRSCGCCGPDGSPQENVIVVQNGTPDKANKIENPTLHAEDDYPPFLAQDKMVLPEPAMHISLVESIFKWLEETELWHGKEVDDAPPSRVEQHLDLLEEIPVEPQVLSPTFDIFTDIHKEMSAWLDQYDVDLEPEANEVQQVAVELETCPRINLLEDLPSHGELITNLCHALKSTPPGTDLVDLRSSTCAEEPTPPLSKPEQLRSLSVTSTQPSISSELWQAEMSNASYPSISTRQESEGDGYDWLPSRKMSPMPRISGVLWTLPLKREQEADDEPSQTFEEDANHPVVERQSTPFVSANETPPPGAPRRFMAAISEGVARSNGLRFPLRIGGLYTGF